MSCSSSTTADFVQQFTNRIKNADDRSTLLAVFDDFSKFQPQQIDDAAGHSRMLLTNAFLDELSPALFGHLSERDFTTFYVDSLLLGPASPPGRTLCALIRQLSSVRPGDAFKFGKLVDLLDKTQRTLLGKALSGIELGSDVCDDELAFTLSSFPDRIFNFFAGPSTDANQIVAQFEHSLLSALLATLDQNRSKGDQADQITAGDQHQKSSYFNAPLFAQILADYNAVSTEFTRRFLTSVLSRPAEPELGALLHSIFAQQTASRRRQEALLLTTVSIAPNGPALRFLFDDRIHLDDKLRTLLVQKAVLGPSKFDANQTTTLMRNSEKVAHWLCSASPLYLLAAFQSLIRLFADHCQIVEMVAMHNHFQLSLAILDFARRLSAEQRHSIRDELMYSLVPIVPQMIELSDCSRRQIGMFMSQTLFELFEFPSPPQFEFVESDLVLQEFRMAVRQVRAADVPSSNAEDTNLPIKERPSSSTEGGNSSKGKKRSAADVRVAILDSDDDEEEEGRKRGGEGSSNEDDCFGDSDDDESGEGPSSSSALDQQFRPAYLRDCVELLAGEKQQDWRRWAGALHAIPQMLRRRAIGWDTLALELLELITSLDNRFGISRFSEIRDDILKLLLSARPELVAHVGRMLATRCCPLSQRYTLISAVVNAAKLLASNGDSETESKQKHLQKQEGTKRQTSDETVDGAAMVVEEDKKRKGPKVIWRSALLEETCNQQQGRENSFSRMAPHFVFPLLVVVPFADAERGGAGGQHRLLMAKLVCAVGVLVTCAAHSFSIVRISSAVFEWLGSVRRAHAACPAMLRACTVCYAALCDAMEPALLRAHFADELQEACVWLAEAARDYQSGDDEATTQCIGALSCRLVQTLAVHNE